MIQPIPAIDIIEGKCVRLQQGDYSLKKIYNEDPLEVAMQFADAGLQRLHLVDLDGAKAGTVKNWKVLEKIASKTALEIDFSGGITSLQNATIAFNSGTAFVCVGSIAVKNESELLLMIQAYGAEKFILGADVKNEKIVISGWTESTNFTVFDMIEKYKTKGISQFICTDVGRDGLLQGPSGDLYKKIRESQPDISLIASGGVSSMNDVEALDAIGCSGVIIGKAIYENRIALSELKNLVA
jgi:phosphoribosylformimino-5-aminoimidazole carboxamide ribotide isomerase